MTVVAVVAAAAAIAISGLCIRTTVAQPYHVATSPTGDDNNIGSAEAPWATLQHAADAVQPGDSVFVLDGSYTGFQIETSGSSSQRIVFLAAGDNVVVDGVNPVRGDHNINVEGADYVTIDGFQVRDAVLAGIRVVTRPVGGGYDAGAFERAASVAVEQRTTSTAFALYPSAPNPFAHVTTIPFELPIEGHALIRLLDIRGRVVATLVDGYQTAGTHSVPINGAALASGVYVVEMRTAEAVRTEMVVRAR
jgi:signal peptidase I